MFHNFKILWMKMNSEIEANTKITGREELLKRREEEFQLVRLFK